MVRTRFAPSPTGYLHIGGARTALFNWLFARHMKGTFVLRIEDTDTQRSTDESVQAIFDGMRWLGLDWDEGPFYQTQRFDRYRFFADKLLAEGKAYHCYCSPEELQARREQAMKEGRKPTYDRRCREQARPVEGRTPVLRFKAPLEGETVVVDAIRGSVAFRNEELDDLVLVRSDGVPTYNFAVVIDDAEMSITHIIRGDDHLNNTPRQIQIYDALGVPLPVFAHVPMILGSDKTRLSKRHGATSVTAYRDMGYLGKAVVNYLVRLGWSCGDQEIFTTDELIEKFNLENIGKSPAVFNPEKLLWLNAHYIKESPAGELADLLWGFMAAQGQERPAFDVYERMIRSLQPRSRTVTEMAEMGHFYLDGSFGYAEEAVKKFFGPPAIAVLEDLKKVIVSSTDMSEKALEEAIRRQADEKGMKLVQVAQPLRLALTGSTVSPGLFDIIGILGAAECGRRIDRAVAEIGKKG